jgi:hypothetical protein
MIEATEVIINNKEGLSDEALAWQGGVIMVSIACLRRKSGIPADGFDGNCRKAARIRRKVPIFVHKRIV